MTTKKQDIWMPLYVADYLAGTTRLTTEQHGAYMLLIMDYWRNGAPPDDDSVLANITRLTSQTWRKHRNSLSRFFIIDGGVWLHKRIDQELQKASDNAATYSNRAKIAADKRWKKNKESIAQAPLNESLNNATSIIKALPEDMLGDASSPSPSPSPSPINQTHTQNTRKEFSPDIEKLNIMLNRAGHSPIDQTRLNQTLVTFNPHYEHTNLTENQRYAKLVTWLRRDDLELKTRQRKTNQSQAQPSLDVNSAWENEPKNDQPISQEESDKFRQELESNSEVFY